MRGSRAQIRSRVTGSQTAKGFAVEGAARGVVEELQRDDDPHVTTRLVVRTRGGRRKIVQAASIATVVPAERDARRRTRAPGARRRAQLRAAGVRVAAAVTVGGADRRRDGRGCRAARRSAALAAGDGRARVSVAAPWRRLADSLACALGRVAGDRGDSLGALRGGATVRLSFAHGGNARVAGLGSALRRAHACGRRRRDRGDPRSARESRADLVRRRLSRPADVPGRTRSTAARRARRRRRRVRVPVRADARARRHARRARGAARVAPGPPPGRRRAARHERRHRGARARHEVVPRPRGHGRRRGADVCRRDHGVPQLPGGGRRRAARRGRPRRRRARGACGGLRPKLLYTIPDHQNPAGRDAVGRAPRTRSSSSPAATAS